MTEFDRGPDDSDLEDRLRSSLALVAPPASSTGVLGSVQRRVARRRRRAREVVGGLLVVLVGGGTAAGLALSASPQMSAVPPTQVTRLPSATVPSPSPSSGSPSSTSSASASGASQGDFNARPATPPPCPAGQKTPSMTSGRFCGSTPGPGNGLGPGGTCTGKETDVPCGPGVKPSQFYAYTVPGNCSGLMDFDGRQWVSEMPPPNPVPAFDVWIQLSANGSVRWIAPTGSVGLVPYRDQALPGCRG